MGSPNKYLRLRPGRYVRLSDGRIAEMIRWHPDFYGKIIVQTQPWGKRRHKHREVVESKEVSYVNEMEVIAEAAR